MTKIEDINKDILFDEPSHIYKLKNGQKLESVSKLLSSYKNVFDPVGHIKRACAKRDGITVEEIQTKWDKERDDACDRGHRLHSQLEHFFKTGKILDDDFKDVVEQFKPLKFTGKIFTETQMFSPAFNIAGTADLITLYPDNTIDLGDFKQNKKMLLKSKYNNKLLYPLNDFSECEFEIYTFQLNLYSYMLKEHGYETNKMTLYYIPPSTRKLEIFDVPKREKETLKLLKHFQAIQTF